MKRRFWCHLVDLSWRLIPVAGLRCWLLRVHLDHCLDCQKRLVTQEEARRLLFPLNNLWSEGLLIRAETLARQDDPNTESSSVKRGGRWLRRIYAGITALIITFLMSGFAWHLASQKGKDYTLQKFDTKKTKTVSNVSINYLQARGHPAAAYIFQTDEPEMIIIWAEAVN
ncbi:MAG: hypothetical protein ACP5SQ_06075 [Candidatus Saccharicenans sp.]